MDAKKALETCPENIPTILLAHQPNAAKKILATTEKKISLILSGHTHVLF
jgi:predicted MPP superfamily phosphohydrolase